jgi:GTP diphosphokinase / guanosine-3',5'-bis(diphosphate) 3'-diphosphatase
LHTFALPKTCLLLLMTIGKNDNKMIAHAFNSLMESCGGFCSEQELDAIRQAYELAGRVHGEQKAENGEYRIIHSMHIARVAMDEIGLGATSVIAALLHDVVNCSEITPAEIRKAFGPVVANLIEEYSKLSNLNTKKIDVNSAMFRNLFMTIVDDIRVILLKLAHRIHDMRTITDLPLAKQEVFVAETEHIYLPITHRLGLYKVKTELEERLMHYLHPDVYSAIAEKIRETEVKRKLFIEEFTTPIRKELYKQGFDIDIVGRPKSIHSIWQKMKRQNVQFEEVYDLFAIRIVINSKPDDEKTDCWKTYSIVTNIYQPNPKRLRDWISTPKASGYESLHTTVLGPGNRWVEVQIRTARMDEMAEKGQAAHWRYKGFDSGDDAQSLLNQVRDILENPDQLNFDSKESPLKAAPSDKIFVFTPDGDLKELPRGSTVLDFAYEIHTRVGDQCNGARVNNKIVPIRHVLNNGDKVEIITSKSQTPKLDWLKFVITTKAKNKIKRSIREMKFRESAEGSDTLRRKLKNWKIPFSDEVIDRLVKHYKFSSALDLYSLIAFDKIDLNEIRQLLLEKEETSKEKAETPREITDKPKVAEEDQYLLIDNKLDHVNYYLAKCCNPIPGDEVHGFVTIGKGISIHRKNCPNAKRMLEKYGYRHIDVKWKSNEEGTTFQATVRITGDDRIGMLGEITSVISGNLRVNMQSIKVETGGKTFTGFIRLTVRDKKHFDELIHKLSKIKGVSKVSRID